MRLSAFAPAKVNLFLHVGAADAASGYHPVASLMVFADVGDQVSVAGADHLDFALDGAFARELAGEPVDRNLVWRAAQALCDVRRMAAARLVAGALEVCSLVITPWRRGRARGALARRLRRRAPAAFRAVLLHSTLVVSSGR